jgi:hypothetical protein
MLHSVPDRSLWGTAGASHCGNAEHTSHENGLLYFIQIQGLGKSPEARTQLKFFLTLSNKGSGEMPSSHEWEFVSQGTSYMANLRAQRITTKVVITSPVGGGAPNGLLSASCGPQQGSHTVTLQSCDPEGASQRMGSGDLCPTDLNSHKDAPVARRQGKMPNSSPSSFPMEIPEDDCRTRMYLKHGYMGRGTPPCPYPAPSAYVSTGNASAVLWPCFLEGSWIRLWISPSVFCSY